MKNIWICRGRQTTLITPEFFCARKMPRVIPVFFRIFDEDLKLFLLVLDDVEMTGTIIHYDGWL